MNTVTAKEVKTLARKLSNAKSTLAACVGNDERVAAIQVVERNLESARGMRCRSAQANADLADAIRWGEQAIRTAESVARTAAVRAHLS